MRFVFGAGGTGGHVVPAIALAQELKQRGHECIFIGNKGSIEERFANSAGFPFNIIRVQKLYRKISLDNLVFPYHLLHSIIKCRKILRDVQADAVITTGGFVAGPVAIAGLINQLPCYLHESNSYPGLTTRCLARYHTCVFVSFEQTRLYLQNAKLTNHGIPLMKNSESSSIKHEDLGLEPSLKTILITGGSQGSLAINKVISSILKQLLDSGWQVIWQTGGTTYQEFTKIHNGTPGLFMFDFHPGLKQMMNLADLAITRAGAMTIAELEATQLPAILIPLPTAAENHQYFNAIAQQQKGCASLLKQSDLNSSTLLSTIEALDLASMKQKLMALPPNHVTGLIIDDILNLTRSR